MIDFQEITPCNCGREGCMGFKSWDLDPYQVVVHADYQKVYACDAERLLSKLDI